MAETEVPITLVMRECANGETMECFFRVNGVALYGSGGVGGFREKPDEREAFDAALLVAQGRVR